MSRRCLCFTAKFNREGVCVRCGMTSKDHEKSVDEFVDMIKNLQRITPSKNQNGDLLS